MQATIEALNISRYDIADKQTGEVIKGAKITFFSDADHSENFSGRKVSEAAAPFELFTQLKGALPCMLDCEIDLTCASLI